jgi:hypothetical protein
MLLAVLGQYDSPHSAAPAAVELAVKRGFCTAEAAKELSDLIYLYTVVTL